MRWFTAIKTFARPLGAVALSAAGPAVGGALVLGLAYSQSEALRGGGPGVASLLLIGGALGCGLVLMPTHVLSLLSGWAIGLPAGLAVAMVGVTLGSPIGYGLGRLLAGPGVMQAVSRNPKATAICRAITRASPIRAAWLVGLLRLSPVVPYGSTNIFAAVFAVPIMPFIVGTVFGLLPRVAAVVMIGAGLEQLDGEQQASPLLLGVGVGATLAAFVLMGWYAKRAINHAVMAAPAAE